MLNGISIIIPTYNEKENIQELIKRLRSALFNSGIFYEIIFIDDNSNDGTVEEINKHINNLPISVYIKNSAFEKKGKAQSLLIGFKVSRFKNLCMIDADLQYPPEAIPEMIRKLKKYDIVVANRQRRNDSGWSRKIASETFRFIFAKLLFNLDCDAQSGLKVFKKKILENIEINPTPWTFDLQFLHKARNIGYKIGNFDIEFSKRHSGDVKLKLLSSIFEIGLQALRLKLTPLHPISFIDKTQPKMMGNGIFYKGNKLVTHTDMHYRNSALQTIVFHQKLFLIIILIVLAISFILNWRATAIIFIAALTIFYFVDLFFNLFLIIRSFKKNTEIKISNREIENLENEKLPVYTIFCPLYKEGKIIPQFVKAISKIDWPKNKLDAQLLLEEDDNETIETLGNMYLPDFFRIIVVPHSEPKTKPKACNYGLAHATGEYAVIYDAEDIPDPKQLKKAFLAFQKKKNKNIICMQAKLNFYNPYQNILTRVFTAEYSLWFDLILPGLQSIKAPIPLGGTSNHFRTKDLHLLKGWDPFNVTEDCDLGMRLCKMGYQTAILDSTTMEEANSDFKNWMRQRSRWIKGYMQTYLVHMRNPKEFISDWKSPDNIIAFQLIIGTRIISVFINPFMWLATISYFSLRSTIGPSIESFFPPVIFYIAVFCLIFGNFLYLYYYILGCYKRKRWDIVIYIFFVPIYWLMISVAAWIALYQIISKPYYWEKTVHGLHLINVKEI